MAEYNVTSQERLCKENFKKESGKNGRSKKYKHKRASQRSKSNQSPCYLKQDKDGNWILSKKLLNRPSPNHNHFIGSIAGDTLANVSDGIATLSSFLETQSDSSAQAKSACGTTRWLALNMIQALEFEINHRSSLK